MSTEVQSARAAASLPPAALKAMIDSGEPLALIDVRSEAEFAAVRLPRSINIPAERLRASPDLAGAGRPVVLICASGMRASAAAPAVAKMCTVSTLEGGLNAWRAAGFAVEATAATTWSLERQVRLAAGMIVIIGVALGAAVHPALYGISAFIGVGLAFSAITNTCGMAMILMRMPWNRPRR